MWSADHEEPGEANWYSLRAVNFGGGEIDSGCAGTTFTVYDNDPRRLTFQLLRAGARLGSICE